jgi:hypothetical protein
MPTSRDDREEILISVEELENEKASTGDNGLSSFAMFTQRKKYKEEVYPTFYTPKPLDLWYDKTKTFYGKVDTNGEPLVLQEQYLKQVSSGSVNSFALDFVVDAFNDFKKKYVFLNKKESDNTPFEFLNPVGGWTSSPVQYNAYLDNVYDLFANSFLQDENREQRILTFEDFLKQFKLFIKYTEGRMPISFSKYTLSNQVSNKSAGLVLEISSDPYSDDLSKYNNFFSNINFECYANTALEFGFRIDKNFPGRLIADVQSGPMQEYMAKYPKRPPEFTVDKPEEPAFNPPDALRQSAQDPWRKNDIVEVVVVRPKSDDDPYYILKKYTDPQNTIYAAGVRPQYSDLNGTLTNEFDYLVDNMLEQGRATKLYLRLVGPEEIPAPVVSNTGGGGTSGPVNTTVNQLNNPFSATGISQQESQQENQGELRITPDASEGSKWAVLVGVERSYPGDVQEFMPGAGSYYARTNNRILFTMSFEKLISPEPFRSPFSHEYRIDSDGNFFLNLPLSAIHLSNITRQPTSTINRIVDFYDEQKRIEKVEQERQNYRRAVYEPQIELYEEALKNWQSLSSSYADAQASYLKDPSPITFKTFTEKRYNKCLDVDIGMMKELLMQFYYSYSNSKPYVFRKEKIFCGNNTVKTKTKVLEREQIYRQQINTKYDARFWIKNYIQIKNLENRKRMTEAQVKNLIKNAMIIYEKSGERESLKFISENFKKMY